MAAKLTDAEKQLERFRTSASQLNRLKNQVEEAQKRTTSLLNKFLDAVKSNPSQWEFKISQKNKTVAEGLLNKQAHDILRAVVGLTGNIPPGEGAGCPDRTGCVVIGQFGNKCFYLCKTTKF